MLPGNLQTVRPLRLAPPPAESAHVAAFLRARHVSHPDPQWIMRVRSRRELATLSDYQLRDIGLTRNDVDRQLTTPFWRD